MLRKFSGTLIDAPVVRELRRLENLNPDPLVEPPAAPQAQGSNQQDQEQVVNAQQPQEVFLTCQANSVFFYQVCVLSCRVVCVQPVKMSITIMCRSVVISYVVTAWAELGRIILGNICAHRVGCPSVQAASGVYISHISILASNILL